jgi:hypothetical protein
MASIKLKGDTSGEVTISAPSVAGTTTLELPATSSTLATQNSLGVRNLIINGDMRIAQRGTSATGITTNTYNVMDRMRDVVATAGTWTTSQSTDVPSGQGFGYSYKWECTTSTASPTALFLQHRLEGQMLQHLKKGTSSAESVTLSFWVKTNKIGTYVAELRDNDNTRLIGKSYTVDTANTWEKKTITFEGDTTGAFDNDNNASLDLSLWFAADSSTFGTGTQQTTWGATVNANRAAGLTVNLADSTSNYINITGLQLEVGTEATPFEHRPYDMELARCQRYYQQVSGEDTSTGGLGCAYHESATSSVLDLRLNTQMRALPTATVSAASDFVINTPTNATAPSSISFYAHTLSSVRLRLVHVSDSYHSRGIRFGATSGRINADAEL